jgi:hypothetical protein
MPLTLLIPIDRSALVLIAYKKACITIHSACIVLLKKPNPPDMSSLNAYIIDPTT